jgi:dephospho-CoA kinase
MAPGSPRKRALVLGLTGPVAGGKTSAAGCLARCGAEVLELDTLGHGLLADPAVRAEVDAAFPEAAGETDPAGLRRLLAKIVFADAERLDRLERILHPRMCDLVRSRLAAREAAGAARAAVVCGAMLYEMGLDEVCNLVVVVDAPEELRRRRVLAGRGWSPAEMARREERQLPAAVKRGRAWRVVDNRGTLKELDAAMTAIWKETTCQ